MRESDIVELLTDLEEFRLKMRNGEITEGCSDWVVRMCQAHIAKKCFTNRNEWTSKEPIQNMYKNYQIL